MIKVSTFLRVAIVTSLGSAAVLLAAPVAHAASSAAPYSDPAAKGYLGICDRAGRQITHGSTKTKPFAWRAVSSTPAVAPYDETGRTATLYAYQPRQDVPAGDWSGEQITSSARYSNVSHPMSAATTGDDSLAEFISDYRPMWDGLLQIRLYLGAPDHPIYSYNYPALTVKVTGNTWQQLGGGTVDCSSGKAESLETQVLPSSVLKPKPSSKPAHTSGTKTAPKHHQKSSKPATASPSAPASSPTFQPLAQTSGSGGGGSSSSTPVWIIVAVLAALLLFTGGFAYRRRTSA